MLTTPFLYTQDQEQNEQRNENSLRIKISYLKVLQFFIFQKLKRDTKFRKQSQNVKRTKIFHDSITTKKKNIYQKKKKNRM